MEKWWVMHKDGLPMDFRPVDRGAVERLTGRMPIFLSALLSIDLGEAVVGGDAEEDDESGDGPLVRSDSTYHKDLHKCYNLLWKARPVELLVFHIDDFVRASRRKYKASDMQKRVFRHPVAVSYANSISA